MRKINRIYVAGGSAERLTLARPWMLRLRESGLEISHDWTFSEGYERHYSLAERQRNAYLDLQGVASADLLWALVPEERGNGGQPTEVGYAYGLNIPIVLSGSKVGRCIFDTVIYPRFEKHEDAFKYILADNYDVEGAKIYDYIGV